ncbi:hypothetical protein KGF54_005192 [Candida jiufengensis]|uniref:uncharacterized protein n=1 Tax=Candida jiufengensis TaxID=497108 RepID=UPI0022245AFE|nr:uncharacterized protein KGF54_005192 [Candida jiufengensis]KAI5950235.1 hypothetical protein KGF54_005192 [Candida jiufengensis]
MKHFLNQYVNLALTILNFIYQYRCFIDFNLILDKIMYKLFHPINGKDQQIVIPIYINKFVPKIELQSHLTQSESEINLPPPPPPQPKEESPIPFPLPEPPEPQPQPQQLPASSPPQSPLIIKTDPVPPNPSISLKKETVTIPPDQLTSSDSESVDSEVKELIKGRESLTFGPDAFPPNNSSQQQQTTGSTTSEESNLASSTMSSTSSSLNRGHHNHHNNNFNHHPGALSKLTDQFGNVYFLHPNGFVTPVRPVSGHIGGSGYASSLNYSQQQQQQQSFFRNINNNSQSLIMPPQTPMPMSNFTPMMMYPNSSTASMAAVTSLSSGSPYRKRFQKFKHLKSHKSSKYSNLKEFQNSILNLAQFSGDLDLGTSNRFGELDSTSIIINSSSANTSSRSSYRSSLRSSLRFSSSRSTKSPPVSKEDIIK